MKSKDFGAFFLLAIGLAAVWFWASGKAGAVWAAINGQTNSANPSGSQAILKNAGTGNANNQQYSPIKGDVNGAGIGVPMGYPSANASQNEITSALQASSTPLLANTQPSVGNNFNLSRFVPPLFVAGYAAQPMLNEQSVSFN